jgi:4-aminobutyrate aminotransferase-like enzyme
MLTEGHVITMNAGTYGNTLRWMPPLTINESEVAQCLAAFEAAMKATA